MCALESGNNAGPRGSLERVRISSIEEFANEHDKVSIPVIITNALEEWNALKTWDLDYLKQAIGNATVSYKRCSSNLHPDFSDVYIVAARSDVYIVAARAVGCVRL